MNWHNRIAIGTHRSKRCAEAFIITEAERYAVKKEGVKGLRRGLVG
jgi:hypothetical protein